MMRITVFFTLLMLIAPAYGGDLEVFMGPFTIQRSYLTGEEFLKLPEIAKVNYSMGIIDGYFSAPMFGGDNKYLNWISNCLEGKANTQISAILVKYLKDNPDRRDKFVQPLIFEALLRSCGK